MIPWWWSWLLTLFGVVGLWLAGSRRRGGWALGIFAQGLWIAYALSTGQYGFIASALAYGFVYVRNYRAWHPALREAPKVPGWYLLREWVPEEQYWTLPRLFHFTGSGHQRNAMSTPLPRANSPLHHTPGFERWWLKLEVPEPPTPLVTPPVAP